MVKYTIGPRGGKYYRKNGRKVYVNKSQSPKKRRSTRRKSQSPKKRRSTRRKSPKRRSTKRKSPKRRVSRSPKLSTSIRCPPKYTQKYLSRPGPPFQANSPGCRNQWAMGNDGFRYKSKRTSAGTYRWVKA